MTFLAPAISSTFWPMAFLSASDLTGPFSVTRPSLTMILSVGT